MKKLTNTILRKLGMKPYFKVKDGGVFACDVDDTLVMWNIPDDYVGPLITTNHEGFKDTCIPNLAAVKHLKKMKARGYSVVVWSAGGSEWAEVAVEALGIQDWVDVIMPKIDFHLDDVHDPKDKLGKWQYVDTDGVYYKLDENGQIKKRQTEKVKGDNND